MSERLRPRDLAILAAESPTTPMHNATVEIFDPGDSGFDHDRLVELIADRIAFVPRYRQRLQVVPARLANPAWVDDENFDLGYHVRRSALPRPGTMDQLRELVARIASRPLDRSRPAVGVLLRGGPRPRPGRAAHQEPRDPRRRPRDRRHRPGAARHLAGPLDARARRRLAPASHVRVRSGVALDRPHRHHGEPAHPVVDDPRQRRGGGPAGVGLRREGRRGRQRARRPRTRALDAGAPQAVAAAALRHRAHRAVGLPRDPRGARRHRQRRHPRHDHRRPARVADGARGVDVGAQGDQGDRADVGHRRRARAHLARQPDHRATRSTSRSASPARWCACTR